MYVNLIHRPSNITHRPMFKLQQKLAHELQLKTTVFLQYENLFEDSLVESIISDKNEYGDEIGLWFSDIPSPYMKGTIDKEEPFLWLYTEPEKRLIITECIRKFNETFGYNPVSVGSYYMDSTSLKILHEVSPETKITIGGCFEEGVKVFHGCNNSWYLFNEGMPFFPWYPSKINSLVSAKDDDDWCGIVVVPHLARDMALSYEGRNDFFATHPANVQRAMANEADVCPYTLNLVDMYRFQERFNDGFSYINSFVGPNWLSGSPNVQDSDEDTQKIYEEYLEYLKFLENKGQVKVTYMSEFADMFTKSVKIGTAQHYFAKELLYGNNKQYYWYCSSQWRLLFDMTQGGSIGDLRPFCGGVPRSTGADTDNLAMGSNPYLIQSQYRTGNSHHFQDGTRTTFLIEYNGEVKDMCDYPTKIVSVNKLGDVTAIELKEQKIKFECGVTVTLNTQIDIYDSGKIIFKRKLCDCNEVNAVFKVTEYVKAGYGVTEYPEDMRDIILSVKNDSLNYSYSSTIISADCGNTCSAVIPKLNVRLLLESCDDRKCTVYAKDGCIFSPYYTLEISSTEGCGKEILTCLRTEKYQSC